MSTASLKDALKNCVINFDRRVNVTDLLQQYKLSYEEVHKTLEEHLRQQESKGIIYEKRFLVQGLEEDCNEVYTVVQGEQKLQDWLQRLQQSQAALYSVEVAGGAKSPPYIFKPAEYHAIELRSVRRRDANLTQETNGNSDLNSADVVQQPKSNGKSTATNAHTSPELVNNTVTYASKPVLANNASVITNKIEKTENKIQKLSPEKSKNTKKSNPDIKKPAVASKKGGISNYFSTSTSTVKNDIKSNAQSNTPSIQMLDYLKKVGLRATETIVTPPHKDTKVAANTSVQLFEEESSDTSSDEEAKLEALKRNIISSDHEEEANKSEEPESSGTKRRRIVDSDEDEPEKPPGKIERKEADEFELHKNDVQEGPPQSETYLDEDGFVITVKPKHAPNKSSTSSIKIKQTARKTSPTKATPATVATKTKQGNIKNFFTKK